jgi:hypothetical protein
MERQNDPELHELLREWTVPDAPASLEARVFENRRSWWGVLIHGYIRVPVPVACCLTALMIVGAWRLASLSVNGCAPARALTPSIAWPKIPAVDPAPRVGTSCAPDSKC